jgi:hypothetical protein
MLAAMCGLREAVCAFTVPAINVENELIDAQSKLDRPGDVF